MTRTIVSRNIIRTLASFDILGIHVAKVLLALMVGYSNANSKGFAAPVGQLKKEGMIEYIPSTRKFRITAAGLMSEDAQGVVPPANIDEFHNLLSSNLRIIHRNAEQMFRLLLAANEYTMNRVDLATAMNYSNANSKGFAAPLKAMRALGLLRVIDGQIILTEACFPAHFAGPPNHDIAPAAVAGV